MDIVGGWLGGGPQRDGLRAEPVTVFGNVAGCGTEVPGLAPELE